MEETVFYGVTNGLWMHVCDIFRLLKSRTNNWTFMLFSKTRIYGIMSLYDLTITH